MPPPHGSLAFLQNSEHWFMDGTFSTIPPSLRACVRAHVRTCVRACVHSCVRAYVRACVRACIRACVRAQVCLCCERVAVVKLSFGRAFHFILWARQTRWVRHTSSMQTSGIKTSNRPLAKQVLHVSLRRCLLLSYV